MDRYFYQLCDLDPTQEEKEEGLLTTKGYCIYDRKVSSRYEIAVCTDIGYAQLIVGLLNGPAPNEFKNRRV